MKPQAGRVLIFDTTLRDGEQSPGASMDLEAKLTMATELAELGVDIIEAGFPAASDGDYEAVREVARRIEGPRIAGLARCLDSDIRRAHDALKDSPRARLHVFLATSAIHREHKLSMAKAEIVRCAVEGVSLARELCDDVEFSPEDASRTELEFLAEVVERTIAAGATTVNIPDTVGYTVPSEFAETIHYLKNNVPNVERAVLSVHCHNDLGLAVANSLSAIQAGARQVECTINGIGERAGNCSLEEIVMALRTRSDFYPFATGVRTERIVPASRTLVQVTGMVVQRNKAIVGQNAFAHEAGIHQHGVLRHRSTYEIMKPEDVGLASNALVLGKHSGRHALRERLRELGYQLDGERLDEAFRRFKQLADKKKEILDGDLAAIVSGEAGTVPAWKLAELSVKAASGSAPVATIRLQHESGRSVSEAACGDGVVEAIFRAIERGSGIAIDLEDYQVRRLGPGSNAKAEVSVLAEVEGRRHRGRAVGRDIMESSAEAFLQVINRVAADREAHPVLAVS